MNLINHDFPATRRSHPAPDVLTATVAVTPDLYLGAVAFGTFEARVTIYRDEADEIAIDSVEVEGWRGRTMTWVPVEEAANGYSVDMPHHVFDAVMGECKRPAVKARLEEAMCAVEEGREA